MIQLNLKRILVPIDFSVTALQAINHAAFLARINKAELFLLHVKKRISPLPPEVSGRIFPEINTNHVSRQQEIEKLAEQIHKNHLVTVHVIICTGNPLTQILKVTEKKHIDLIVMGTRGADSTSSLFAGSNSHRLVAKSEIPVITVREDAKRLGYQRIVLPIDTSEHSRQKVNAAIQVAKMFASKIHVLGLVGKNDDYEARKLNVKLQQVKTRLKDAGVRYNSEIAKTDDPSGKTISIARKNNADMIIAMADHKDLFSGFARKYDQQLIDESEIPVLSIPPEIHEENIEPASINGLW
jgi:nucleotide-binding universal stress UspA family protein